MMHKLTSGCLAVLLFSCGDGGGAGKTTERYYLDADLFANEMADKLIAMGRVTRRTRTLLVSKLKASKFEIDLAEDGSFEARQHIGGAHHVFTGTWELSGSSIRLDQTHEDGEAKKDSMRGTLSQGTMTLVDEEQGVEFTIVLKHASLAAAPR